MHRLYFLLVVLLGACQQAPSVSVDDELLVGKYVGDNVAAFLGVPFAEPPVGDLRWRAPQPLMTKQDRRATTEFAAACMQTMRILDWYRYMAETFGASADYYDDLAISEDCLYLNLWTPTLDTEAKLPVMVWIHGGSNKSGWSYEPNYDGHVLAQKNVVVVSVAYRHGVFGFLSHPELNGHEAVANFGLWDIIASLKWIRNYVEQFGGDPDRITLFGESSGAENILALMAAKPVAALFHHGILQSTAGYGLAMPTLDEEQQRGTELARIFGLSGRDALAKLRKVPAESLLQKYEQAFADHYHSPAVDGQLIKESTWDSIQTGRISGYPMMIGANADESLDRQTTASDYLCPTQSTAASMEAAGGDAWVYYFTRVRADAGGQQVGAYHGAEIPYAFGTHDAYMLTNNTDLALTATVMDYWVRFAARGDPNGPHLPEWPRFRRPEAMVQELGDEVRTIPAIEPGMCVSFESWNDNR